MPKIPAFKPHFVVKIIPGEGVLLLRETGSYVLNGLLYEKVAALIDGKTTSDEIVAALESDFQVEGIQYAIQLLEKRGYILDVSQAPIDNSSAYWSIDGLDIGEVSKRISQARVWVQSPKGVNNQYLIQAFEEQNLHLAKSVQDATILIVYTDNYLNLDLKDISKNARALKIPLLLVRPKGQEIWVGPWFKPDQSGCYECLRDRLKRHHMIEEFLFEHDGSVLGSAKSSIPSSELIAAASAATEVVNFIARAGESNLVNKVLSLNTKNLEVEYHPLAPSKWCPVCGDEDFQPKMPLPIALNENKDIDEKQDGGYRTVSPQETYDRYKHLVSPITGIISHLKKVEQGVAFVYNAGHNFAFKIDSLSALKKNMRSASSGKGMTEIQAKTSALCEGIERYSGMYSGREYSVRDSYKGSLVVDKIHPNDCMLYSDKQYADRELWNSKKSRFNWVPEHFDEDAIINWTPVWSLTHKKFKYLPTQYVYYDAPLGDVSGRRLSPASSNGNATGNTFEEAILQAFFELVERDCVALWWYNRLNKPLVDIESFNDPSMMRLVDFYKSINREVWVLDLTSDLGIPCFVALSRIQDSADEQIFFGFGCHFDARIGVSRAIAEMSQMLGIAGITGKKVPLSASVDDPETVDWFNNATLEREPYLKPSQNESARRMEDYPKISSGNLLKDILKCNEIVSSKGMEMLVVDQTREEAGMPAAKVIVPGLVHFWARYAPGRLYTVPVQMGWIKKPKLENEMNPTLMFI